MGRPLSTQQGPKPTVYLASQSPRRQELLTQLDWDFELLLPQSLADLGNLSELSELSALSALSALSELSAFAALPGFSRKRATLGETPLSPTKPQALTLSEALEDLERAQAGEGALAYVQRVTRLKFHLARRSARALGVAYRASSPILCADTTVVLNGGILGKPRTPQEAKTMLGALSGRTHRVYTSVVVGDLKTFDQRLSRSWVTFAPLQARVLECYVQTEEWRGKAGGYAVQGLAAAFIEEIRGSYSGIMGLPLFETAALLDDFVKRRKT